MIFDPNVAYVILVVAFILEILALSAPGTGFLEFFAAGAMIAAGYVLFQLPINAWALIILVAGLTFFFIGLRQNQRRQQWLFLALSLFSFWGGSVLMFRSPSGGLAINLGLAGAVSVLAGGFMWFIFTKGIEAIHMPVLHTTPNVVGLEGMSLTRISQEGTVQAGGETWSARSSTPISAHSRVRVVARHGLTLDVEEIKD
ncbi:MAG: hypothetical protein LWX83_01885 [Anaerolineae bacterium]|nr:hypothetical protein [Anaerolineae bacterium]